DFAIIEDRKFKTGPKGLVRGNGPRPDHINDLEFDVSTLDVPEAQLLGERQLEFLESWTRDWRGAEFKAVLSQTVFGNASHRSGPGLWGGALARVDLDKQRGSRLRSDLDSNGWPQSGRDRAVELIRRGFATHLCGDQHLATLVHHGVTDWRDSMVSFASPAIVNYYVRWWDPLEVAVDPIDGALPNLGSYRDGLGNRLTMLAYVNPDTRRVFHTDENGLEWGPRAEGYGIVRFDKDTREITYEVWPRYVDVTDRDAEPYAGWPVTIDQADNYGRRPAGYLPMIEVDGIDEPVFEVVDQQTGEVVYTIRANEPRMQPHVFDRSSVYTVHVSGQPGPRRTLTDLRPTAQRRGDTIRVSF
ncbi:MAG: hypothetical protein AAFU70_06185, partial [Planctomycetota bacterium]